MVAVRVEASYRQVRSDRQSALKSRDCNHRLLEESVAGRIDRRLGWQSRCQRRQIIGRITCQIQRGLSTMEPWHLRSVPQRNQALTLRLVDAIPGGVGVIQRHRIRRIATVGIRDPLGGVDVAKPRERGQSSSGFITSARDKAERIPRSLCGSKYRPKAGISFCHPTTPDDASAGVMIAGGGVDSVYNQQLVFVLGHEVKRLHAIGAVVDGRGRSLERSDRRDLGHLEATVDVDRAITSFGITKGSRVPAATGMDHDEKGAFIATPCRISRTGKRGRCHHSNPALGGEL